VTTRQWFDSVSIALCVCLVSECSDGQLTANLDRQLNFKTRIEHWVRSCILANGFRLVRILGGVRMALGVSLLSLTFSET
jgi:hypothetical protein